MKYYLLIYGNLWKYANIIYLFDVVFKSNKLGQKLFYLLFKDIYIKHK